MSNPPPKVGFDIETFLIKPGRLPPRLVCLSMHDGEEGYLFGNDDPRTLTEVAHDLITNGTVAVAHRASFDTLGLMAFDGSLIEPMLDAAMDGRISCTRIRENLLNLATTGRLDVLELPDGTKVKIKNSLAELEKKYLGIDRSALKTGEDIWRLNYSMLSGVPAADYPEEARTYAIDDSEYALKIHDEQDKAAKKLAETQLGDVDIFASEALHVCADIALQAASFWGIAIDAKAKAKIDAMLREELDPAKFPLLYESGIIRPAIKSKPYANQKKKALEALGAADEAVLEDLSPEQEEALKGAGVKFTAPKDESKNTTVLKDMVTDVCEAHELPIEMTAGKNPQVSTKESVLHKIAHLNPTLEQYQERQKLQKLVTTEMPRLTWDYENNLTAKEAVKKLAAGDVEKVDIRTAHTVHPEFAVLKETGRTSSYAGNLLPGCNAQNVDPRARGCYVARPGQVLVSTDYTGLELVTLGQKCLELFGESKLAERMNGDGNAHGYLGAQLANFWDPDFSTMLEEAGGKTGEDAYEAFLSLKDLDVEALTVGGEPATAEKFYGHWRNFAKPVGLGFPGGLGAKTFVDFARSPYGVTITEEEAKMAKQVWLATYPEMKEYLQWISKGCVDPFIVDPETKKPLYAYVTKMGMVRRGASYTAAANGAGLQSPGAEGAKHAVFWLFRACVDKSLDSILYGCKLLNFIHDEVIMELPEDELLTPRIHAIEEIMRVSLNEVCPDMTVRTESVVMRAWNKYAKTVIDDDGNYQVWEPKEVA